MSFHDYYEHYWSSDGFHPTGGSSPAIEHLLEAHTREGQRCLDIGCGDGRTAGGWLAGHGRKYTGADISENAVAEAVQQGLDAIRIDDSARLPFADSSFDAVLAIEVLEHVFDPARTAKEAFRVLRPGGMFIATTPNIAYWRRRLDIAVFGRWNPMGDAQSVQAPWRDPHIRFFTQRSLARMLSDIGFNSVEIGGHEGALTRDIPGLRNVLWRDRPSAPFKWAEQTWPSVFALRLHAIAVKPN